MPYAPARRAARVWALVLVATLVAAACGPSTLPPPEADRTLVVAVLPGPASWFPGPDREPRGLDHDLLARFAAEHQWKLKVVTAVSPADVIAKVAAGAVHVGAGGLFPHLDAKVAGDRVMWTIPYCDVEPVVIHPIDGFAPRDLDDLAGARVAYRADSGIDVSLARTRAAHPEIRWEAVELASPQALITQVDQGRIDFAVVESNEAAVARHAHLDFAIALRAGESRGLAWAVPTGRTALRDAIDAYFAKAGSDGSLAQLVNLYLGPARDYGRSGADALVEKIRTVLPQYRRAFQEAQDATGIEWRLLAAIAWQESQWDPLATSETGVRGFMQLTEQTAQHLGVIDRLDARASILAAARYFADLKAKLPARIAEPDRTWIALAAFNLGFGHVEDARVLAQKRGLNPDRWNDVRQALPLLAEPEHHEQTKLGYARGGMPVAFVDKVRGFYDVLLEQQPAWQPRLRVP